MAERYPANTDHDFYCESFLSKTKISSGIKIPRMQIALIRHSLLVICLYFVLSYASENPRLDHKVDTRKAADTPMVDDNGSDMACLNKTNMKYHNTYIKTPKHSFLLICSTDTNCDQLN